MAEVSVGARVLGRGSLGEVRAGEWRGAPVALKSLHLLNDMALAPQQLAEVRDAFEKECGLLHRCRHPNVVLFLGMVAHPDGAPAYIMTELIEGGTLHDAVHGAAPASLCKVLLLLLGAARGVAYLHSERIVHRDLKPANVLIAPGDVAKISDLGEARQRASETLTGGGSHGVGAPLYMAPEMREEEAQRTPKIDVFSFAVMAAEAAARRVPQPGPLFARLRGRRVVVSEQERRRADVAAVPQPPLRALVQRCIADDDVERPDAAELVAALEGMVRAAGTAPGGGGGTEGAEDELCAVCIDARRSHAFTPCGHLASAKRAVPGWRSALCAAPRCRTWCVYSSERGGDCPLSTAHSLK